MFHLCVVAHIDQAKTAGESWFGLMSDKHQLVVTPRTFSAKLKSLPAGA
jgi:hypothetical protein